MADAAGDALGPAALDAVRRFVARVSRDYGATTALEDGLVIDLRAEGLAEVSAAPAAGSPPDQQADLVVSFDAAARVVRWAEHLGGLAGRARKAMVVVTPNPERLALPRGGQPGRETRSLAPVLWAAGRVREHAYLGVPRLAALAAGDSPDGVYQAPVGRPIRRTAILHAFVLDLRPRTPQARRRLQTAV